MSLGAKYWLWVALLGGLAAVLAAAAGFAFWADLQPPERAALAAMLEARGPLLVLLALLPAVVIGALLRLALAAYPAAAVKLAEEVRLIHSVNPGHRATAGGAAEMRQLVAAVNDFAQAHDALGQKVQARIDEANARLAEERNRLAALMSELAQSVLVCNSEGRILLYNARASGLLEPVGGDVPVGLGRSIFGILDRSPIVHALGQLAHRIEQGTAQPVARFVTTRGGRLLRAQMAPVPGRLGAIGGFVLMLEDITRSIETTSRRDQLLQQVTEGSRAALGNLRAAAETIQQYPDMEPARRERFFGVIGDEAQRLSRQLDEALAAQGSAARAPWLQEDMLAGDLVFALRNNLPAGPRLAADGALDAVPLWLSVDSFAMVQALTHLASRLALAFGLDEIGLSLAAQGRWARLSLAWTGDALDPALLHEWESQPLSIRPAGGAATLKEVLDQHGAEMWCQPGVAGGAQQLHLQLPAAGQPEPLATQPPATGGRPVYYDFDLFGQPGQSPELDDRPLAELAYTVFDTETTGLSPSEGDEIISIGAVRILNGRLLEQECFDRLVRPLRPVRRDAQAVHGIATDMLDGQPTVEEVLPVFHRFAEDTVIVAHNAAFDMRLLQLAEARTGVAFTQPVLDTLLLSALVHPGHGDVEHRLENIAARLGVRVVGRHTALGDAMMTAEVFLKLVPLLAERGIHTLGQAREASQKTFYAKLEY